MVLDIVFLKKDVAKWRDEFGYKDVSWNISTRILVWD